MERARDAAQESGAKPMRNKLTFLVLLVSAASVQASLITETKLPTDADSSDAVSRLEFVQQMLAGHTLFHSRSEHTPLYEPLAGGTSSTPFPIAKEPLPESAASGLGELPSFSLKLGFVSLDMAKINAVALPSDPSPDPIPNPEPNSLAIWLIAAVTYVGAIRKRKSVS